MHKKYKDIATSDLERIYSFTKSELSDKEQLYLDQPNQVLNTQIQGLREVTSAIEHELLLRSISNSSDRV